MFRSGSPKGNFNAHRQSRRIKIFLPLPVRSAEILIERNIGLWKTNVVALSGFVLIDGGVGGAR